VLGVVVEVQPVLDRTVLGGEGGLHLCQEIHENKNRTKWTYAILSLLGVRVMSSSSSDKRCFFLGDICNEV
jgi:hypothetical protein